MNSIYVHMCVPITAKEPKPRQPLCHQAWKPTAYSGTLTKYRYCRLREGHDGPHKWWSATNSRTWPVLDSLADKGE